MDRTKSLPLVLAASSILLLGACAKKTEVVVATPPPPFKADVVQVGERSKYFETVNKQLELGGTLYGYADVDGDVDDVANTVQRALNNLATVQPQFAAVSKTDFKALFREIGLTDVKALGLSSVRREDGLYRNRTFIYTPEGRHGLLAVFGGKPAPFEGTSLAPADVDFYAEHEFDVEALYQTVKLVITRVSGPDVAAKFENEVRAAGAQKHFSLLNVLEGLQGRVTMFFRMDPTKTVTLPGKMPFTFPETMALVRIDGIGPAIEPILQDPSTNLTPSTEGDLHLYIEKGTESDPDLKFVAAVRGKQLFLATSVDFLHECLNRKDGLNTSPAFTQALAAMGSEGNGLTWVTPHFFSRLKETAAANAQSNPTIRNILDGISASLPAVDQPLLSVRTNQDDGVLVRSTWNRSLKENIAMITVYNPLTIGLMAAMAIPAFQNVRSASQAKAIMNNLRMLSAAADEYYLENGVDTATFENLVGPDKYVKTVKSVAGERYQDIVFRKGRPLRVKLPDGRVFQYPYSAQQPRSLNRGQGSGTIKLNKPTPAPAPPAE